MITASIDASTKPEELARSPKRLIGSGTTPISSSPEAALPTADVPVHESTSTPIEIWEGKVLSVDGVGQSMYVSLSSKMGKYADHSAKIDFEWISEQDKSLVRPGAIFYWILYKETRHGSIRNSQELRFRRFPTWSRTQIKRMRAIADLLLNDTKPARQLNPRTGK
jgi:hypothetical protein